MEFTKDQQKVIDTRNKNILVSAAAGSGKTAVLVARILSLITDRENPCDIDRLLIVTFTSAAASEMRERIHGGILQLLDANPSDTNLQRQSALIHNAQITTIDSFCLFLLRNHFHEIDLDPAFRIGDPGEIKLIEKQVLRDTLEEFYARKEEGFLKFADAYCPDGKDGKLEAMIEELYHYSMSHPWPVEWLQECDNQIEQLSPENLFQTAWMEYGMQSACDILEDALFMADSAVKICEKPDGPYMYGDMVEEDRKQMEQLHTLLKGCKGAAEFEKLTEALAQVKWQRLSTKSDPAVSPEQRNAVKLLRERYKDMVSDMVKQYFAQTPEELVEKENAAGFLNHQLILVTKTYIENLEKVKKEKNVLDFSDMEHYALKVLIRDGKPTETAQSYQNYFQEVMIDEYQDSNMVQELLLSSVSRQEEGKQNRFMVGDMKQSIYKFRLAKPEIFMEKYHAYQEESQGDCLISLKKNFRSRGEILDSTNAVFSLLMRPQVGGVSYDEDAMLYQGARYPQAEDCETELCLFEYTSDGQLDKRTAEAYMIARKIKELIQNGLSGHAISYKDIVILFRSGATMAEDLRSVLLSEGIPAYVTSRTGYFSANEVSLLMNLLRVLNNPYEDIPFCSVATSLFFGFTQEELALIRAMSTRGVSLYESFREIAQGEEIEIHGMENQETGNRETENQETEIPREKITASLSLLEELRREAVVKSMPELVNSILRRFHYVEYVSAMPAGQQRKANVEMFVQKAVDFEQTSFHGLFHFIRYMEQLQKYDVDYGEASTQAENEDVVRIMTIHKSKGLEFPVCFVAGLDRRYNLRDTTGSVLIDADWGIASDYVDTEKHLTGKTFRKMLLSRKMRRDSLGEELRVLYVAMTRAKEKLILTGAVSNLEKKLEEAASLTGAEKNRVPVSVLADANSSLSYILMAYEASREHMELISMKEEDLQIAQAEHLSERLVREQMLAMLGKLQTLDSRELQEKQNHLKEKFAYVYPHEALSRLYTKTSVSELKKAAMEEEEIPVMFETDDVEKEYLPAFMRGEKTLHEGAARGSAMHRLLELLDFSKYADAAQDLNAIKGQGTTECLHTADDLQKLLEEDIRQFVANGRLGSEYARLISTNKVVTFLQSSLVRRMAVAQKERKLFKEQPFVMEVGAAMLNPAFPPQEKVLIQGIIDVYFEEEDSIIILDYKTDRVSTSEELLDRYRSQLDYYEEAVEKLTGKRVKEKVIYSFACMEEIAWK